MRAFEDLAPEVVDEPLVGGDTRIGAGEERLLVGGRLDDDLAARRRRRERRRRRRARELFMVTSVAGKTERRAHRGSELTSFSDFAISRRRSAVAPYFA